MSLNSGIKLDTAVVSSSVMEKVCVMWGDSDEVGGIPAGKSENGFPETKVTEVWDTARCMLMAPKFLLCGTQNNFGLR
jgi:hypothetical protein